MPSLQKNPRRLLLQIRPQSNEELWHKWAHDIREELWLHYDMNNQIPFPGSRLKRTDELRRLFDSHGSNLEEAIMTPDNHPTYWKELASHPGSSKAKVGEGLSAWEAFDKVKHLINPNNWVIYEVSYA